MGEKLWVSTESPGPDWSDPEGSAEGVLVPST